MQVRWYGHSTFTIAFKSGATVLLDPWIEGNPARPEGLDVDQADYLLVTHGHSGHTGGVVRLAQTLQPKSVVAIFELAMYFGSKGVTNVTGMNKGGSLALDGLRVVMTHAMHSPSVQDGEQVRYAGEPAGFILQSPGSPTVYFAGDTTVFGDMALLRELYRPQVAFLPIGDLYTMGPQEAALACRLPQPDVVIPMHYGSLPPLTGTPDELEELIREQGTTTQVKALAPGKTLTL